MVSALASEKFASNHSVTMYDFDPDGTDPVDVGWVDLRDYEGIHVTAFRSVGTGTIAAFQILGNSASDGSGSDVVLKSHALGSAPDAVGDYIHLEVTAAELAALGTDLRYVSASLDLAVATDECVVTYIRYNSKRATSGLTADSIA